MKYLIILLIFLPALCICQVRHAGNAKIKIKAKPVEAPFDGYIITGNIKGFPDGTPVSFLNEQTGVPEQQGVIKSNKFEIKGKMEQPGVKSLVIANGPPAITIFLDNSRVKILGDKTSLEKAIITGSPSHDLFSGYVNAIRPYEKIFQPDAELDSNSIRKVMQISEAFVRKNPTSFVTPLAVIRLYQATEDGVKAEQLYNLMPDAVKNSPWGAYANSQIQESKINPLGSLVSDFAEPDTSGIPVNISSYRGKYVLVDFWASWCRPCRQENPNLVAAYNKYKGKNFTVLGISLDQAKPAWIDAIKMDNLNWKHISDLKGWGNAVAGMFHISSIPQNLLLDPSGRIIGKNLRGSKLDRKLEIVLR